MSNSAAAEALPIRVVFFGMRCAASVPPLAALLNAGIEVRAVVLPAPSQGPPVQALLPLAPLPSGSERQEQPEREMVMLRQFTAFGEHRKEGDVPILHDPEALGLVSLAQSAGLPVLEAASLRHPALFAAVAAHRPDAIVTACFPRRLPPALLAVPRLGGINVHPSLLPVGRGPDPVFWTLRRGERRTGATIHQMDARFDTGPILAQQAMDVPSGVRAPDLELQLARLGAGLLVPALHALASDRASPLPQNDALATRAPLPKAADYVVPTNLPARWAYNFVRGVAPLGGPLLLHVLSSGESFSVRDATTCADEGTLDRPVVRMGTDLLVRFRPGTVLFASAEVDSTLSNMLLEFPLCRNASAGGAPESCGPQWSGDRSGIFAAPSEKEV
ncbi:MAG: hypothetical protein M3Q71_01830 [Chloroflexota bacterium]|nr:hypothetical protein [Chloroflexota bacterium]